ncbi:parasitophorous vacuolar protein 1 [Plasmodium gonderi]|uniref:Parasitophorous vacuolar protein 1 n=1 Tax=Plasmodium gonderi TaxID=77519 RepID=A0A1Y1JFN2_PLAGO|nr:parasitophorous vacuolar protein 1 [Plasmodium gonderi]GAW81060.1 parasitophorous vacuolar protein 1 [Plasmodium gonderi]
MMKKAALSVLLILLSTYVKCEENEKKLPPEIEFITGKLETPNSDHDKFLQLINGVFTKKDENYKFSFSNNGFKCALNKFDITFNNKTKAMNTLFTSENEQSIKEAAEEYKVRLMLELDNIRTSRGNLKNFKKDFQGICMNFFHELRRKFFHIYRSDEGSTDGDHLNGKGDIMTSEQLAERFESNYDSSQSGDSEAAGTHGKDGNQDLSELIEDDVEDNPDAPNSHQSSYAFSTHTSKKIIFDGNNVIEENESITNDGDDQNDDKLLQGPMTKEKVLTIMLKYSSFNIEGNCTEEDQTKEKPFTVFFTSQMSRNNFSTVCNTNGTNYLRKAQGGNFPFPMDPIKPEDLNRMMADMLKFFENQTEGNAMLLPFLSKMNFMDALGSLGLPQGLDFDKMFNGYLQGNVTTTPSPCCRGSRPNIKRPSTDGGDSTLPPTIDDSNDQN